MRPATGPFPVGARFIPDIGKRKLIDEIIKQNWSVRDPREKKDYSYTELLFIIQEMLTEEGRFYAEGQNINRGFEVFRNFAKML
ncbi:MAG: hypothetical protein R6T87_12740, partial [Marinobacter sp.]